MRQIENATITKAVRDLAIGAACDLEPDILDALLAARDRERAPLAKNILELLITNSDIASRERIPICQDTGTGVVFVFLGQEVMVQGNLMDAIQEGVRPVYGHQWRSWPTPDGRQIDQIRNLLHQIETNPDSRRLIVSAWNVADVDRMALPPCHCLFQFYVADGKLSCQLYQRSADVFLGVPFNIASYALLTMMVAQVTGLQAHEFIHTFGDAHLYHNHFDQARLQLTREPKPLPTMHLNPDVRSLFDFTYDDFSLEGYEAHPHISAPVAV